MAPAKVSPNETEAWIANRTKRLGRGWFPAIEWALRSPRSANQPYLPATPRKRSDIELEIEKWLTT